MDYLESIRQAKQLLVKVQGYAYHYIQNNGPLMFRNVVSLVAINGRSLP